MVKKIDLPASKAFSVHPPTSVIMATCISSDGKPNIIPLGMYMWISFNPPLLVIGVSPKRFSHHQIKETGEFVVNIPSKRLIKKVELCGSISGRDKDKFKEANLTPLKAEKVKPPLIKECISHMECKVIASHELGDHTLFVGEVVHAKVNDGLLKETFDIPKAKPLATKTGYYFIPKQVYKRQ